MPCQVAPQMNKLGGYRKDGWVAGIKYQEFICISMGEKKIITKSYKVSFSNCIPFFPFMFLYKTNSPHGNEKSLKPQNESLFWQDSCQDV